jgi:predicted nucleic-acid-binding protein
MQILIDANVILRFLLNDNKEMSKRAADIIYSGACTNEAVLAEVVYVLKGVYKMNRGDITKYLTSLLELVEIENQRVIVYALNLYSQNTLDFIDCLLIAYHKILSIPVLSFDKKLRNMSI